MRQAGKCPSTTWQSFLPEESAAGFPRRTSGLTRRKRESPPDLSDDAPVVYPPFCQELQHEFTLDSNNVIDLKYLLIKVYNRCSLSLSVSSGTKQS